MTEIQRDSESAFPLVFEDARAPLAITNLDLGLAAWQEGISSGISSLDWDHLNRDGVLPKGPMTTPHGGGMKMPECNAV